jgi:hypothetical protein
MSAKSRTRRSSRLATRGVPRERRAISKPPSASSGTSSRPAERRNDLRQFLGAVELEPGDDAEAVAQRVGEHAGARRRADQRERLQLELDRARRRPVADHDVDLVVLERRIEDLLDDRREAMDLVDEEDVVLLEVGEDRGEVLGLFEHRPRGLAQVHAELVGDDVRERRLAEPGGPNRSTWSIASPRILAAPMKISSCSRAFAWPTYSASPLGRSARSIASSFGRAGNAAHDPRAVRRRARRRPGAKSSVWMLMRHYRTCATASAPPTIAPCPRPALLA